MRSLANSTLLLKLHIILWALSYAQCAQSYIYLSDKSIKEELPVATLVANLKSEVTAKNDFKNSQDETFTLLEDSKLSRGNVYFRLDSITGELTTNQYIDRESMCLNRLCADPCEEHQAHLHHPIANFNGSCRINLKVLMLPSANILNMNVFIVDINDNRPLFRSQSVTKQINENVPVGYKIPVALAYDPDIGKNKIQSYEIITSDNKGEEEVMKTFKLAQNLNDAQLHLVVIEPLDRERVAKYEFVIAAIDGGEPSLRSEINMTIDIIDINDNNPIFERRLYNFTVSEDLPIDSKIGQIKASDLDSGDNGLIKYSFVDKSIGKSSDTSRLIKYFNLDKSTGELKLKKALDYEQDSEFTLTVEARDSGVGSLPTFATVQIDVVDINDNSPDIGVSFLSLLHKNSSDGVRTDLYLPENTKANKFLAHVNIKDQDSGLNGQVKWRILLDNVEFSNSKRINSKTESTTMSESMLKLILLNENSFTINVGNSLLLDREKAYKHDISIIAWDQGTPKLAPTFFNFSIIITDENDNAPQFERKNYEISVYENQPVNMVLFKLKATDTDSTEANSHVDYSIREEYAKQYVDISADGVIRSRTSFDRETLDRLTFHVVASDRGEPTSLTSVARVVLSILDKNDNAPKIYFNTSLYHSLQSDGIHLRVGQYLSVNSKLVDFSAIDHDLDKNARFEFQIEGYERLPFQLTHDGHLVLTESLENKFHSIYQFKVLCRDGGLEESLSSSLAIYVEVTDSNEFCIQTFNDGRDKKFLNRDLLLANEKQSTARSILFEPEFILNAENREDMLVIELMNHKDLIDVKLQHIKPIYSFEENRARLEISLRPELNISQLIIGKYKIQIKLRSKQNPSCGKIEQFTLLIGNNFMNEKEILTYIDSSETNNANVEAKNQQQLTKTSNVKPATIFIKSDYVLLFILIVIILITAILLIFIGIICFCNRVKRQYGQKRRSDSKKAVYLPSSSNPSDDAGSNDIEINVSAKKTKKLRMKKVDLNASSTSNSSSSSSSHGKPQYLLVNNNCSSSSSSSSHAGNNGTLIYRDPDFDEFGLNPSSIQLVNNQKSDRFTKLAQQGYQKHQHTRFIYSSTIGGNNDLNNVLNVYDSSNDRSSHSATNSIIESTTVDDSKSTSSNNDFEIMGPMNSVNVRPNHLVVKNNPNKFRSCKMPHSHSHNEHTSSAYSSISDNGLVEHKRSDSKNFQEPSSPSNPNGNNLLTFNRTGVNVKVNSNDTIHAGTVNNLRRGSNHNNHPNSNSNSGNYSNYGISRNIRTSFNL